MQSAIYKGRVIHHRKKPKEHLFSYNIFMMYLDLDELPDLFSTFLFWYSCSFNLAWFAQQSKCSSHQLPVAICGSFYAIGEVLNFFHAFPKEQKFTRDLSGFSLLEPNESCQ